MIVQRLGDGKLALTFVQHMQGAFGPHQGSFPAAIVSLLDSYPATSVKLTLARGRWLEQWGRSIEAVAPPGATFTVDWHPLVRAPDIPHLWTGVTNAVSGILCTSLTALKHPPPPASSLICNEPPHVFFPSPATEPGSASDAATTPPQAGAEGKPHVSTTSSSADAADSTAELSTADVHSAAGGAKLAGEPGDAAAKLHADESAAASAAAPGAAQRRTGNGTRCTYGVLPQEAICTENLTSYLKLLPCRRHAGLMSLLTPSVVFATPFHALSIEAGTTGTGVITVRLSFTLVLPADAKGGDRQGGHASLMQQLQLSTQSLTVCPYARTTAVHILNLEDVRDDRSAHLAVDAERGWRCGEQAALGGLLSGWRATSCSVVPAENGRPVPLDVTLGRVEHDDATPASQMRASQHLLGMGDEKAVWELDLLRIDTADSAHSGTSPTPLTVCFSAQVPWQLQGWVHTLQVHVDGVAFPFAHADVVHWKRIVPSRAWVHPMVLEACSTVSGPRRRLRFTMAVSKSLLYVNSYPPDAARGFDLPAVRVLVEPSDPHAASGADGLRDCGHGIHGHDDKQGQENGTLHGSAGETAQLHSPLLSTYRCQQRQQLHSNSVVFTLPSPDFSMPYNVCALSSSLLAIFVGLFTSALLARPREAARRRLSRSASRQRALKLAVVTALMVVLIPYFDDEWATWVEEQLAAAGLLEAVRGAQHTIGDLLGAERPR